MCWKGAIFRAHTGPERLRTSSPSSSVTLSHAVFGVFRRHVVSRPMLSNRPGREAFLRTPWIDAAFFFFFFFCAGCPSKQIIKTGCCFVLFLNINIVSARATGEMWISEYLFNDVIYSESEAGSSEIPKFIAKTLWAFWPFAADKGLFLPSKTDVIKETYLQ